MKENFTIIDNGRFDELTPNEEAKILGGCLIDVCGVKACGVDSPCGANAGYIDEIPEQNKYRIV